MANFKVGDRVVHALYGGGVIKRDDKTSIPYYVVFDKLVEGGLNSQDSGHGWWCHVSNLAPENTTNTIEKPKASAPAKAERKFKVGDRVESLTVNDCGIGVVIKDNEDGSYQVKWLTWHGECRDGEDVLKLALRTPAIVALIENDKPRPNKKPYVHDTTEAATKEAERLASKYPGQKFGVYQLVTARIGAVSVVEA